MHTARDVAFQALIAKFQVSLVHIVKKPAATVTTEFAETPINAHQGIEVF
jgi:hypothetical protein